MYHRRNTVGVRVAVFVTWWFTRSRRTFGSFAGQNHKSTRGANIKSIKLESGTRRKGINLVEPVIGYFQVCRKEAHRMAIAYSEGLPYDDRIPSASKPKEMRWIWLLWDHVGQSLLLQRTHAHHLNLALDCDLQQGSMQVRCQGLQRFGTIRPEKQHLARFCVWGFCQHHPETLLFLRTNIGAEPSSSGNWWRECRAHVTWAVKNKSRRRVS